MNITSISILTSALLWWFVPAVFCVAFFLWWRRLRHWSFAVLSAATALYVIAEVCSFVASNIPQIGKLPEADAGVLLQVEIALNLVMGVLLLLGACGLLSAARDDFILSDAEKRESIPEANSGVRT